MSAVGMEAGRRRGMVALGAAGWLGLAATPTFAAMALLTAVGSGAADTMGMAMPGTSPFGGMATMYLLMAAFHAGPWLKLVAGPRSAACG